MKYVTLVLFTSLLICACKANKRVVIENGYDVQQLLSKMDSAGIDISNDSILYEYGYHFIYEGGNRVGNALIKHAMSMKDYPTANDYRSWSVQNTKNGNYAIAIEKLEKSMELDAEDVSGYYGWVLLYYYRDYEKALQVLEQTDAFTPDIVDAPWGEDIHYLKGLCHMQLLNFQTAINEFNLYIKNATEDRGEDWVDVYTFVHKGRCLDEQGKFDEAISSFQTAVKHYENCTEAYYFMGITQTKMGDKETACTNFNKALHLIGQGYRNSDVYVELFHEIYPQEVEIRIAENCRM